MKRLVEYFEKQPAMDRLADRVKRQVDLVLDSMPNRQEAMDFLNGVWLGHPLHPALTHVPVGAWTATALLDALSLPRKKPSKTATVTMAIGVAGATAAAPAGLADWYHLSGERRRLATGHALLNTAALSCYALSLLARLTGKGPARLLGFLGFGIANASAFLGGMLVYQGWVGVTRRAETEAPGPWRSVLSESEVKEGSLVRVEVGGYPVVIGQSHGRIFALSDVCTHMGCSLSQGTLQGGALVCPCHGSRFSTDDGSVLDGPATASLTSFNVMTRDGQIEIGEPR